MKEREQVRNWVTEWLYGNGKKHFQLADLVNETIEHFKPEPEFISNLMCDELFNTVYAIAQEVLNTGRRRTVFADGVVVDGIDGLEGAVKDDDEDRARRWATHYEFDGEEHVLVVEMNKKNLLGAKEERLRQGTPHIRLAHVWDKLAEGMKGNQRVGTCYTSEQLDEIWDESEGAINDILVDLS